MSSARSARVTSLERALHFSLAAWRDSWFVLSLSVLGPAVMFFGEHGPVSRDLGMALIAGGAGWSALMFAPLTAGLYRSALNRYSGPEARRYPQGLGGFRLGAAELRMVGLAILMFLLAVLFLAPAALVAAAVAFVFRSQGELSVLGALRYGAYCGLGVLALYPFVALRVALGGVATVAEDGIRLFQTWPMTQKRLVALGLPLVVILLLYPLALSAAALANLQETGDFALGASRWPVLDALGGAVLSGLFHGALMPALFAGALTHLYLKWRPDVPAVARRKPVLRVVADLVETGAGQGDAADAVAAANDGDAYGRPEDDRLVAGQTRRSAAAYQIGADRIQWPDHRSVAFDTSGQAFGEPAPPAPTPVPEGVWPEMEAMAQRYARSYEPVLGVAGPAGHPPVFDGEGHEHARSPIDPSVTSLEHPMLLAPERSWTVLEPAGGAHDGTPAAAVESGTAQQPETSPESGPDAERRLDSAPQKDLADLFWLSGVVPPEVMASSGPEAAAAEPEVAKPAVPEAAAALPGLPRPEAANADDLAEEAGRAPVLALAPSAQDAPPPVQVIAYLPPRPFHPVATGLDAAVAANDAAPPPVAPEVLTPAVPPVRETLEAAEGQEG